MRIVILTDHEDRHYYFCNQIIEKTGNVVGVVAGGKSINRSRVQRLALIIKKHQLLSYIRNRVIKVVFYRAGELLRREKQVAEDKYFGGAANYFSKHNKSLLLAEVQKEHRSINDEFYVSLIRKSKPDIIVVMGTCLVGKEIISSAKCVLNIHTGLSPYYRGDATNLWPFITKEIGYFGVTIHTMSLGIDSGDIVFTARPDICPDDDYGTINSKCVVMGTELMIQAIRLYEEGSLNAAKQWTKGKLFYNRDKNNYIAYQYLKNKDKILLKYVELAEQGKLPKVTLISNGEEV